MGLQDLGCRVAANNTAWNELSCTRNISSVSPNLTSIRVVDGATATVAAVEMFWRSVTTSDRPQQWQVQTKWRMVMGLEEFGRDYYG